MLEIVKSIKCFNITLMSYICAYETISMCILVIIRSNIPGIIAVNTIVYRQHYISCFIVNKIEFDPYIYYTYFNSACRCVMQPDREVSSPY